ncbi:MAG: hypothetical protein L6R37_006427 [Teloschistes peruensis]|nr:MAG: hypothetical protein L6R37_006427 [Teloschistes peruensis]
MKGQVLLNAELDACLPLLAQGKVRNIYQVNDGTILLVTTDRISAFDSIMSNGIPNKGCLLTLLTAYWSRLLPAAVPGLRTHLITLDLPKEISPSLRDQFINRSMQVQKLAPFKIEAIVRGYITGSAWKSYQADGTVCGIKIEPGLKESEAFPGGPIYTPSTKAELGAHDENIHPDKAKEIVGAKYAARIEELALACYRYAADYTLARGIIIADTKFEFGLDVETDEVVLMDEILTPDSSRFWPADAYRVGETPPSFDKQYLRDWLTSQGLKHKPTGTVEMPDEIVTKTDEKYREAFKKITGADWETQTDLKTEQ